MLYSVNKPMRTTPRRAAYLAAAMLALSAVSVAADARTTTIDMVILVDSSLSMAPYMDDVKSYVAGDLVAGLVIPGDWVALLRFDGETRDVWQGDVVPDAGALLAAVGSMKADGRYTDIGIALDALDSLLLQRGRPERPKYILMLTDGRQEALTGSRYYSRDYEARHPLLEYLKREQRHGYAVLTLGYGMSGRVEDDARSMMTTLLEPPLAEPAVDVVELGAAGLPGTAAPGASTGAPTPAGGGGTPTSDVPSGDGTAAAGADGSPTAAPAAGPSAQTTGAPVGPARSGVPFPWGTVLAIGGGLLAAVLLAIVSAALFRRARDRREEKRRQEERRRFMEAQAAGKAKP